MSVICPAFYLKLFLPKRLLQTWLHSAASLHGDITRRWLHRRFAKEGVWNYCKVVWRTCLSHLVWLCCLNPRVHPSYSLLILCRAFFSLYGDHQLVPICFFTCFLWAFFVLLHNSNNRIFKQTCNLLFFVIHRSSICYRVGLCRNGALGSG